jgi:hypothetical protein
MNYLRLLQLRRAMAPETGSGSGGEGFEAGHEGDADTGGELDDGGEDPDDLGDVDPDAGHDDEPGGEEDGDEPPIQRQPSRAQRRIEAQQREVQAERERADRLERELAEARRVREHQSSEAARRAEEERLAVMSPEERLEYRVEQAERRAEARFQHLQFQQQDVADKATFQAACRDNPAFDTVKTEVEAELEKMRKAGTTAPRETIALYLIGKRAVERAGRVKGQAGRRAAEARSRETARPGGARSDVRPQQPKGDSAEARRKRLENMEL